MFTIVLYVYIVELLGELMHVYFNDDLILTTWIEWCSGYMLQWDTYTNYPDLNEKEPY